jgi:hypothetical protein
MAGERAESFSSRKWCAGSNPLSVCVRRRTGSPGLGPKDEQAVREGPPHAKPPTMSTIPYTTEREERSELHT